MSNINVHVDEMDEHTLFTSKTLKFNSLTIQTPCKLFDLNGLPVESIASPIESLDADLFNAVQMVERSQLIRTVEFKNAADSPTPSLLTSYNSFKSKAKTRNKQFINSLTFQFNPIAEYKADAEAYIESVLTVYHGRSDILLIPNLKIDKMDNSSQKQHKIQITPYNDYLKYIEMAYPVLEYRNSKPIFVPLPLRYGIKVFSKIVDRFLSEGYRYFWMDFEGGGITSKIQLVRAYHVAIGKHGVEEDTVLYGSNIRREKNPHRTESACAAGDIISAPLGIDIIGVNREPMAWPRKPSTPIPHGEKVEYQARLLNRADYMYERLSDSAKRDQLLNKYNITSYQVFQKPKFYSGVVNTFEMNEELALHRRMVAENDSLLNYLGKKEAIDANTLHGFEKGNTGQRTKPVSLDDFF